MFLLNHGKERQDEEGRLPTFSSALLLVALAACGRDEVIASENAPFVPGSTTEITSLKPAMEFERGVLSNGMQISDWLIRSFTIEDGMSIHVVDTGYGREYDCTVFDPGDGKPYVIEYPIEDDAHESEGVKRYNLTYTFGDKYRVEYPIWEPTAFRSHPEYGFW